MSNEEQSLLQGPKSGIPLIDEVRAHLPSPGAQWFVADHLLKKLADACEELLANNRALTSRLVEREGDKWGSIQVDAVQPMKIWVLLYKENGKRKVAFSLDGAPSDKYILMVDAKGIR